MTTKKEHSKQKTGKVIKGLYIVGSTWAAIFSPIVLVILAFIIPFGDAITRSYILKLANTQAGKIFLFLTISLPIWFALQQILTLLHQYNIYPKREKGLTYLLALAWTIHAIYVLFVRL
ncbi:hypothetical protein J3U42_00245 [Gilliamella sp. B2923]|uniref:fumarate reductase subunit FrdD n=1 Tax=unclassified Gilliamella TaxID=2685620 RepID=UPI001C6994FC|nr:MULTISPECIES: fumarate reductase subunit FrdD [unclassified Gilliamella]MCX8616822.1 hypothetical protein [Gilliamella sp. B2923]QYN47547.1 hypothetical protein GYM74_10220 [Gilliamella sp. ESL0405]